MLSTFCQLITNKCKDDQKENERTMTKIVYNSLGHDLGPSIWAVSFESCGFWYRDNGWRSINSSRR